MNDQSGTAQLRFLEETAIRLRQNGFTVEPIEDHHLPVRWEKGRLCRVSGKGSVLYRQECVDSVRAQDALQTVIETAKMTSEYMAILESAPRLKASGLTGDYRVLADFGSAVLAGHPTERGVQFVTWEWDFDRKGVHHGHYFQEDYDAAKRDFTDVRDVVRAYALLAQHGRAGETYNVGSGTAVAIQEILTQIIAQSGAEIQVEIDPAKLRPVEIPVIRADISKLQQDTGWTPEIPLEQTIAETLDVWKQQLQK